MTATDHEYRAPAMPGGTRDDYGTAYMNGELYDVDARAPEARGRLGVSVRMIRAESDSLALVEFVSGVEKRYRRVPFVMERRYLRKVDDR